MSDIDWRKHYAGLAMQGLLSNPTWAGTMSTESMMDCADKAAKQADFLIDALNAEPITHKVETITPKAGQVSIEALELTGRSENCLRSANIETIDELVTCNLEFLKSIPGLGKKSLREIIYELDKRGLSLHV